MVMPVASTPGFAAFKQLTFDLRCPNSLFHGHRISDSGNSVFLRLREVSNVCNLKCVCLCYGTHRLLDLWAAESKVRQLKLSSSFRLRQLPCPF
jgi:hypothetical protein